ncbi:MAG: O-antigen ligase domain-containing protein [Sphingobacteriaceae bacterium]|nr:MAG: O-antigen ligase domain-containing protein [Sphingobacteriaceae bacterium]
MKTYPAAQQTANNGKNRILHVSNPFGKPLLNLNGFAVAAMLLAALIFPLLIAKAGYVAGVLLLLLVIGIPFLYGVVVYPEMGILTLLISAYLVMWVIRIGVNFPLGTLMDALQLLLIIGFFIRQKQHPDWSIIKTPIGLVILIWIGYNLLEVINPTAASRMAWLYTIRSVAAVTLTYFVFVYQIKTIRFVRLAIKVWLGLSLFAAAYGFKQEHYGFFAFEQAQLNDPLMISLLFINGVWRKFSIFSDPVSFSYNMVISSVFCICLMTGTFKTWKKVVMLFLALFFLLNMLYSGTRGAYVLFPAALVLIAVINYSRKVLIMSIICGVMIGVMIFMPTGNATLLRFQSAFKPANDASYNVRAINQKRIQPYIWSHPIGGGLGATGVWGIRFAPGSFLAGFPPDSGYVRVAVELGWVGLLLICSMMFIILKTGINNYFKIKNPELKAYCLAATAVVFVLNIGNFPQEAIVQFPGNILFYFATALISISLKLDQTPAQSPVNETTTNY